MEVIRNQEFLLLPATEIAKLLASDDMNIPNEETILNALLTWVRHDLEQRRKDLSKLLAYIRLPLRELLLEAISQNSPMFAWTPARGRFTFENGGGGPVCPAREASKV